MNSPAFFYRRFLNKKTSYPVEKITINHVEVLPNIFGYQALVHLKESLLPKKNCLIHSNATGCGSALTEKQAIFKALSEAFERWAYHESKRRGDDLFFDQYPDSTGFAAYPGLTHKHSMKYALFEAFERWCIHEFNTSSLPLENIPTEKQHFYFYSSSVKLFFYIAWDTTVEQCYIYGFGASDSLEDARNSALKELVRNKRSISYSYKKNILTSENPLEKKLLFFSTKAGFEIFNDKIKISLRTPTLKHEPILILKQSVIGKWTGYTKVSRVLFQKNNLNVNDKSNDYFYF